MVSFREVTWTKLDDGFDRHPKILAVGLMAELLQIHALNYCNRYLTDGLVPWGAVVTLGVPKPVVLVGHLIKEGLWHDEGTSCESKNCPASLLPIQVGHYGIHDFWEWQRSRKQVLAERARNAKRQADLRGSNAVTEPVTRVSVAAPPSRPVPSVGSLEPRPRDNATSVGTALKRATDGAGQAARLRDVASSALARKGDS